MFSLASELSNKMNNILVLSSVLAEFGRRSEKVINVHELIH